MKQHGLFCVVLTAIGPTAGTPLAAAPAESTGRPPDVVVILADNLIPWPDPACDTPRAMFRIAMAARPEPGREPDLRSALNEEER